jgi:hypothetical protein
MTEDRAARLKAQLIAARARGDAAAVRRLLAALQRLRRPENALAPRDAETREG